MILAELNILGVSDREESDIMTVLLSREDALKCIDESILPMRVVTNDKEIKEKLMKLDPGSQIYLDFLSIHEDSVMFEIYPAEILKTIPDKCHISITVE